MDFLSIVMWYVQHEQFIHVVSLQTELEECTEILSQMVNRLYLRTPRKKIIEQSQICHRKRAEFITAISKGLVPPETPPGLRKKRRKYSMETEDVSNLKIEEAVKIWFSKGEFYNSKWEHSRLKVPFQKYSWTSITWTSLGPCKFVLDIGGSSHWELIITPGQEANGYNLGMSFRSSI